MDLLSKIIRISIVEIFIPDLLLIDTKLLKHYAKNIVSLTTEIHKESDPPCKIKKVGSKILSRLKNATNLREAHIVY